MSWSWSVTTGYFIRIPLVASRVGWNGSRVEAMPRCRRPSPARFDFPVSSHYHPARQEGDPGACRGRAGHFLEKRFRIPKEEGFPLLWKERSADRSIAGTFPYVRESVSNMRKGEAGGQTPAGEGRDLRPPSVRSQDAAIWEYAVRNRLLRGRGTPADTRRDAQAAEAPPAERMPRPPRRGAAGAAARAEGLYRRIAPPGQKYPLRAVTLVRSLLDEGAPEEFVRGKYQMHARNCGDIGVAPMPLIPYLAELLEIVLLDMNAARRDETVRERSIP